MADLWANYFETLVTPLQDNGIYDQFHKNDIENQVNDIIQNSEDITDSIFNVPLTIQEFHEVIRSLSSGEAPGFDGITYEHLKYGGKTMVRALLKFHNHIIDREEIPDSFQIIPDSVQIPILKSNKKTHTFDDHRGIK